MAGSALSAVVAPGYYPAVVAEATLAESAGGVGWRSRLVSTSYGDCARY